MTETLQIDKVETNYGYGSLDIQENRTALINDYNAVAGPPSAQMAAFQTEFLGGMMSPHDRTAFAQVCFGLLTAALQSGKFPA